MDAGDADVQRLVFPRYNVVDAMHREVDASAMWNGPGIGIVRAALSDLGVRRVVEIREHGDLGSRLDLDVFAPTYTGAEGVWTDDTLDWIACASHQSSVAFGGTLAERHRTS